MTSYLVTTRHPTGWRDGAHIFVVKDAPGNRGRFYATATGFGCSKDYPSPLAAICGMSADHGCTVIAIREGV